MSRQDVCVFILGGTGRSRESECLEPLRLVNRVLPQAGQKGKITSPTAQVGRR